MLRSELLRRAAEVEREGCRASWQDVWALVDVTEAKGKAGKQIGE